eukprot:TRINITY_DN1747_c0_g4_i1.p1 TRINITY_DN1747_c0_g4~~TRINITY_DN1747_c0_g4_i1.p1  ORF type:complete len:258 (+),score=65.33 TRINITY_DN1747_c0_g4_i1:69-842(+)
MGSRSTRTVCVLLVCVAGLNLIVVHRWGRQVSTAAPPPTDPRYAVPTICSDWDTNCRSWADAGECGRNRVYMHESCRKACGLCEGKGQQKQERQRQVLVLNATIGAVRLRLRPDLSPATVARVAAGARSGVCRSCRWYRNEEVPKSRPADCGAIGPCGPYSLIQGYLDSLENAASEQAPLMKRGMVGRIRGGDFFIALADHSAWGHSFTVFAEVADEGSMAVLEAVAKLPWHEQRSGQTVMRMLDTELPFSAAVVSG